MTIYPMVPRIRLMSGLRRFEEVVRAAVCDDALIDEQRSVVGDDEALCRPGVLCSRVLLLGSSTPVRLLRMPSPKVPADFHSRAIFHTDEETGIK
jgi:hypothetical protein